MTIKTKVIASVFLATVVTTIAVIKSSDGMETANMEKMKSVKTAKLGEIEAYFSYLSGLLTSLADQEGTQEGFVSLRDGFYKLNEELGLDKGMVVSALKSNYTVEYLNQVNYEVPNSAQRRDVSAYIPADDNAKIAQYVFIIDNSAALGSKNEMSYNAKYDSTYM